jgi:hypothetical protein
MTDATNKEIEAIAHCIDLRNRYKKALKMTLKAYGLAPDQVNDAVGLAGNASWALFSRYIDHDTPK